LTTDSQTNTFKAIVTAIKEAKNIVITSHKSPDGDSIGSSLALYHFIGALGKSSVVCHPDKAPNFLLWVEGALDIVSYEEQQDEVIQKMRDADLIFCLDYNSADRVGKDMQTLLEQASAKKIMIDHHMHPADFCEIIVSETSVCSTSQLIFELIAQSGNSELLNESIGVPIYLGIMTDTGSFRFPSVQARTHEILAALIRTGIKHFEIHEKVYDTNTVDRLQLRGYALSEKLELIENYPVALISVTEEELNRFHYQKGDTEGLVNVALSVDSIKVAAFFAEKDGAVKISFRSKGDYFVNELANDHFEGGGHKYAAGGISFDSLENTINKFKSLIPTYFK
jgi:bifunctional oligoribonuclease and PAP phosphatase NrnA